MLADLETGGWGMPSVYCLAKYKMYRIGNIWLLWTYNCHVILVLTTTPSFCWLLTCLPLLAKGISRLCLGSGPGLPLQYLPTSLLSLCWSVSQTQAPQRILSFHVYIQRVCRLGSTSLPCLHSAGCWDLCWLSHRPCVQSRELSRDDLLSSGPAEISVVAVHSKMLFFFFSCWDCGSKCLHR